MRFFEYMQKKYIPFSFFLRSVAQVLAFFFLAKVIEPKIYGEIVPFLILITLLSSLADNGAYSLMIKYREKGMAYTDIFNLILGSFILLLLFFFIIGVFICLKLGFNIVIFVFTMILVSIQQIITSCLSGDCVYHGSGIIILKISIYQSFSYMVLILGCLVFDINFERWAILYIFSTLISLFFILKENGKMIRFKKIKVLFNKSFLKEGFLFSIGSGLQTINNDADKFILSRFSTTDTSLYTVAYRIIGIGNFPIGAYLSSVYSQFFTPNSSKILIKIVLNSVTLALLISILIFFTSHEIPNIIGEKYTPSVEITKLLLPIIILQALRTPILDYLSGSNLQSVRILIVFSCSLLNILLNVFFIPKFGYKAAIYSSLLCEFYILTCAFICVFFVLKKERKQK